MILGSKESLGKPSIGFVYFVIIVLGYINAMGSIIACNGAMDDGNDCVNLVMAL